MRTDKRKPVMALMGEFSAGKSTLANLLIGAGVSPVKVTATQLPPVWFKHGTGRPTVVDLEGRETEIDAAEMEAVEIRTTAYIRVFVEAELLELMDIIDMPGNSDPNMSSEVWRRAIHHADGVIWCSHANQAWRQSEAAVWEDLPPELYPNSILLLTRFDKIRGESDRARLLRRVRVETEGLFQDVLPISLIEAMQAGDDRAVWEESGAEAFLSALLDIVMGTTLDAERVAPVPVKEPVAASERGPESSMVIPRRVAVQRRDPEDDRAQSRSAG